MARFHKIVGGPLETNCYIVYEGAEALVVDPGVEPQRILSLVRSLGLRVRYVVVTHGHPDHFFYIDEVSRALGAPVYIHERDSVLIDTYSVYGEALYRERFRRPERLYYIDEGSGLVIGDLVVRVLHTPGHTMGSISLLVEDEAVLVGDVLFRGSIGRTDLPESSEEDMARTLKRLSRLDDSLLVLPGHGEETTLGHEKRHNPFLRELLGED